jgi:predicted HicB family RNase H-like nuclease
MVHAISSFNEAIFKRSRYQMLIYKGYMGHVEFDDEADIFHGEVINTRDVITFQGKTVAEIKKAFHESINGYLKQLSIIFRNNLN